MRCANGFQCEVFKPTGEAYCQPNCSLNNGGCPADKECRLQPVICVRAPCPSLIECVERTTECPPTCSKEFCSRKGNRRAMCSKWVPIYIYNNSCICVHAASEEFKSLSRPLSLPPFDFLSLSLALILKRHRAAQDLVSWPTAMPATMMRSHAPLQNTAQSVRTIKTIWQTRDASVAGPSASGGINGSLAARYNFKFVRSYCLTCIFN
jgi:hypothetical protein